ncbi:MAG: Gfo/Idh/MocA family oxidoreductase [Candidatus Peribacteraceae bacterium]|nr:Gfo/Idh/MocA family oxidoreductase [Candidatus Peribacteraceae bacterium]MDD5075439.1 Gfo/Idh/MocA family oxidoreductase [Candidatus Peribacteraceae bacterium]
MRFLLCGIGSIGQRHYRNLRSLGQDVAILRSGKNTGYNRKFLDDFFEGEKREGHPVVEFHDFREALSTFDPQAVCVTTPNAHHLETALQAARAGKHLFIEKPVATSMDGVQELNDLARKKHLIVSVGYNLRFHPLLKKMKELMEAGAIGKALSAHVEMGENIEDWHPWEDYTSSYGPWREKGGGAVFCFSHDIDYLYWFLGMPEKILAVGGKMTPLKGDAEDMVKSLWTFPGGAIASMHLDYWQRPRRRSFSLIGTEGSLLWDYEAKTLVFSSRKQGEDAQEWNLPNFERNDMFVEEMRNYINAVEKKTAPAVSLPEGMDVLRICLNIREQILH